MSVSPATQPFRLLRVVWKQPFAAIGSHWPLCNPPAAEQPQTRIERKGQSHGNVLLVGSHTCSHSEANFFALCAIRRLWGEQICQSNPLRIQLATWSKSHMRATSDIELLQAARRCHETSALDAHQPDMGFFSRHAPDMARATQLWHCQYVTSTLLPKCS